jgi:hypothetical protein
MEKEEVYRPSEYSLAPRTYLPPEKKYSSEDLIKAEVTVEKFELYDKGYDTSTYMVLLWLQTEHTSANRLYVKEEGDLQVIDSSSNEKGQVSITWEGTTVKLLGYYKELGGGDCMLCGNSTKEVPDLPSIGVRVYILGSEGGWVEYGNAVIEGGGGGEVDIVSTFLKTENQDSVVGKLVVAEITPPLARLSHTQGIIIDYDFSAQDSNHWEDKVNILELKGGRAVSNVLEPRIGYGVYVIPRAFFFLPGYRPMYFNPDWLEALLSYSFKIHQVEHLDLGEGYRKMGLPSPTQFVKGRTVQELGGMFRAAMIAFVHGLTFFVTRFIYQPDKYPCVGDREGGGLEVEIYSKDVLTLGAGDCEDVAYLLQQMCLEIKRAKTDKGIIGFCKRMLQYYIPVHCLVQAVAPKMPTHVGTASEPVIVEYGLCHLQKAQETMTHYHVVAILIPTSDIAKFFARSAVGLKDKNNQTKLNEYKQLVHSNRKALGMPIQEKGDKNIPPYHKLVTRLIMEGTSSIHADHLKRALSATQVEALGVAVQAGEEPIKGYTFQNFDGGSIMYGAGIQFASEEFLKVAPSPLATVVVTMEDGEDYLGPMEYMLSYQSYAKKIKLIPGLETPTITPIPAWYDPPTPVLTVSKEEFYKELKNMPTIIQYPDDPVIGKWSKEETDIPYLPWNLTTPEVTPQYLSGLETA